MKFFPKLLLILIPLVVFPSVFISLTVSERGNRIIQELVLRNAELELKTLLGLCADEVATLEKLSIDNMAFYRNGAQRRVLTYANERNLPWGFLFFAESSTGIPISVPEELDTGLVTVFETFEPWGWRVGVAVRNSYINSFLKESLRDTLLLVSGLFILLVFIVLALARYLVRPIQALVEGAERMSAGDLTVRVNVGSRDETGRLGQAFNEMAGSLEHLTANLEDQVRERTEALSSSLEELQNAQDLLVRRERMANLGGIVAGVAHEINTPLGIGVTSSSYIKEIVDNVACKLKDDTLTMNDFDSFLSDASKASELLLDNLNRARNLVSNFKQLAVDQTVEEKRSFNLGKYITSTVEGMYPRLRQTAVTVDLNLKPNIVLVSYPGFFYQIISNLIINSLIHGYDEKETGCISIAVERKDTDIVLVYQDDGRGISPEIAEKVYEPFVTTRSGDGGSGLGMNIVFNLVNRRLNGQIQLKTAPGEGVVFTITFPDNQIL